MGQGPDQIESRIGATVDRLGENLHELEGRVKSVTDWRGQFRRRPMALAGLAFAGGILLSVLTSGRARPPRGPGLRHF